MSNILSNKEATVNLVKNSKLTQSSNTDIVSFIEIISKMAKSSDLYGKPSHHYECTHPFNKQYWVLTSSVPGSGNKK